MSLAATWTQLLELLAETLWRQVQVAVRRAETNLAHVGRQRGDHPVQVRAVLDPRTQSMHGKGMSKIVHARLVDRPVVAGNARDSAKPFERPSQSALIQSVTVLIKKKLRRSHLYLSVIGDMISPQHFVQVRTNGYLPRTVELIAPNRDTPLAEVNVIT